MTTGNNIKNTLSVEIFVIFLTMFFAIPAFAITASSTAIISKKSSLATSTSVLNISYPINITLNGSAKISTIPYEKLFTVSWNAPWADFCYLTGFSKLKFESGKTMADSVVKLGAVDSKRMYTNVGGNYVTPLQFSVTCSSDNKKVFNVSKSFLVPVEKPSSPLFDFLSPKTDAVLSKGEPHTIQWNTPVTNKISFKLFNAKNGEVVSSSESRLSALPNVIGNHGYQDWDISSIKDGEYYLGLAEINGISTDIVKSGVFKITSPTGWPAKQAKSLNQTIWNRLYDLTIVAWKHNLTDESVFGKKGTFVSVCQSGELDAIALIKKGAKNVLVDRVSAGVSCVSDKNRFAISVSLLDDSQYNVKQVWCIDSLGNSNFGVISNDSVSCVLSK